MKFPKSINNQKLRNPFRPKLRGHKKYRSNFGNLTAFTWRPLGSSKTSVWAKNFNHLIQNFTFALRSISVNLMLSYNIGKAGRRRDEETEFE